MTINSNTCTFHIFSLNCFIPLYPIIFLSLWVFGTVIYLSAHSGHLCWVVMWFDKIQNVTNLLIFLQVPSTSLVMRELRETLLQSLTTVFGGDTLGDDPFGEVAYPKHHKQSKVANIYRIAAKTKVYKTSCQIIKRNYPLLLFLLTENLIFKMKF